MKNEFLGAVKLCEGKTKTILLIPDSTQIMMVAKNSVSRENGAKTWFFNSKAKFSTTTSCFTFKLLEACGIPTSFISQASKDTLIAHKATMIPFEIVIRRVAKGSYLQRFPHISSGQFLHKLIVELFLKSSGKNFSGVELSEDDMYVSQIDESGVYLQHPKEPISQNKPIFLSKDLFFPFDNLIDLSEKIVELACKVFLCLEFAWKIQNFCLLDLKIECGFSFDGKLMLSDVIDNDNWRLTDLDGNFLSPQIKDSTQDLERKYKIVAKYASQFACLLNKPYIILWTGSEKDDVSVFYSYLQQLNNPVHLIHITGSMHKNPEWCLKKIREILDTIKTPAVIITYVGKSNGLGPIFAAETHLPVISVPASDFSLDVWSSLRVPSDVPLMTILDPINAIQAALNILSFHSPQAYMTRNIIIEKNKFE